MVQDLEALIIIKLHLEEHKEPLNYNKRKMVLRGDLLSPVSSKQAPVISLIVAKRTSTSNC